MARSPGARRRDRAVLNFFWGGIQLVSLRGCPRVGDSAAEVAEITKGVGLIRCHVIRGFTEHREIMGGAWKDLGQCDEVSLDIGCGMKADSVAPMCAGVELILVTSVSGGEEHSVDHGGIVADLFRSQAELLQDIGQDRFDPRQHSR